MLEPAWLNGREVLSVAVSRDGSRVALVTQTSAGTALEVSEVVRDESGTPVRLGESSRQGRMLQQMRQVQWTDEATLAVLETSRLSARETIHLVQLSGQVEALSPVDNPRWFVAGKNRQSVFLLTDSGQLLQRIGMNWILVLDHVAWVGYPPLVLPHG